MRPTPELVDKVAAKPYDVLNSAEAKAEAKGNPYSFLRISKPEINFDEKIDQYADEVYAKGKEIFDDFVSKGIYIRERQTTNWPNGWLLHRRLLCKQHKKTRISPPRQRKR